MSNEKDIEIIKGDVKVVLTRLSGLEKWTESIAKQTKLTNGKVNKHETSIELLKHSTKVDDALHTQIEKWSRKKLLLIFGGAITFFIIVLTSVIQLLIEYIKVRW